MKKKIYLIILVLVSVGLLTQGQFARKKYYRVKPLKNRKLVGVKANNTIIFSQANLFIRSNDNRVFGYFILRNNHGNGKFINGAKVFLNNQRINATNNPGEYKGFASLFRNNNRMYPINIKIVTINKRVLTANGAIDALLKMEVSNIFPRQPNKIDVGSPVRVNWFFTPRKRKAVTLSIVNINNNFNIYKKTFNRNKVLIPVRVIPRHKHIRIKVTVPTIFLRYNQPTHQGSYIKIHVNDEIDLQTFG